MTETWPGAPAQRVVLLTEGLTAVERRVFRRWLERARPAGSAVAVVHLPRGGGLSVQGRVVLREALQHDDDPLLVPVTVVWRGAAPGKGVSPVRALLAGDPRRPFGLAQPLLSLRDPTSARVVVARSALLSEVRERHAARTGEVDEEGLLAYVARQATLTIEQAVSGALGPQYKVPRLVRQEVALSARFREAVEGLAAQLGRSVADVRAEAEADLDELVTGWSRLLVDLQAQLGRTVYRLGYDEQIEYDDAQVERLRDALSTNPGVLLMSHRSHLDGTVLPVALAENGLPRTHLLAGINMSFWPFGTLMRRAGVIFIRREFRDDAVYKTVLRQYVSYLVEKRFHLQWSIEGTRSRTGKMEPPKLGLLSYVVDALYEGRAEDVVLAPVSIAYDQIHEVGEFASYAAGAEKKAEGLAWAARWLQGQRRGFGKIYVSFAEPISLRTELGDLSAPRDPNQLHKLALEVAWRMNRATPITGAALLTTVLLGVRGRALTLGQVRSALETALEHAAARGLPLAASARALQTAEGVSDVLQALGKHDVVSCYSGGTEPVWRVRQGSDHTASFYRNSLIHFFLESALAELALAHVAASSGEDPLEEFWQQAYALRDLLKFDFVLPDKDEFRAQLQHELALQAPDWEERVKDGRADEVLRRMPLHVAGVLLGPFLEAYGIVADVLQGFGDGAADAAELRRRSLSVGRQYLLQGHVQSAESVSSLLFRTGVQLAAHRGLLAGGPDAHAARVAFSWHVRDVLQRSEDSLRSGDRRMAALVARA